MTVEVTVKTAEPTPTAVVAAATTWAEFPKVWRPMLDKVWGFLRGDAPEGLYQHGHNIMLYKDDVPNVEVGVQVSGSFEPAGDVVASTLPAGLVATATHTGPIVKIGDTHQGGAVTAGKPPPRPATRRPSRCHRPQAQPFRCALTQPGSGQTLSKSPRQRKRPGPLFGPGPLIAAAAG
jgi:effector-binding domain-containing protein